MINKIIKDSYTTGLAVLANQTNGDPFMAQRKRFLLRFGQQLMDYTIQQKINFSMDSF